jgi:peptidyl-dipeptidase Dcp
MKWDTAFQAIPFNLIKNEHFIPAMKKVLKIARENIARSRTIRKRQLSRNTIEALETARRGFSVSIRHFL